MFGSMPFPSRDIEELRESFAKKKKKSLVEYAARIALCRSEIKQMEIVKERFPAQADYIGKKIQKEMEDIIDAEISLQKWNDDENTELWVKYRSVQSNG